MSLKEILKKIKPTAKEIAKSKRISQKIINEIKKEGYEAVVVGSRARDTFIANDRDLDIFVYFPEGTTKEDLEKKGVELGKKILKDNDPQTHYAEHPYVKGVVEGLAVEIVPCYKIKEKIISAVDRSPLHNEYLSKKMREEQKDEVRLLKQFIKAINCYGADQKTKGFSGYLCELLIINYGDFEKTVASAAGEWDKRIIVDTEKQRKEYEKFKESLVVIDPVDRERNVAAAVSRKILTKFMLQARKYMENPDASLFIEQKPEINVKDELEGRNIILIKFKAPEVVGEILWSQLERLTGKIKETLIENEFFVYKTGYWTDENDCAVIIEMPTLELSGHKKHTGPEVWDAENAKAFIEKNPKYWIKRSTLCAWKKREYPTAEGLIKNLLGKKEMIPSHLQRVTEKSKMLTNKKAAKQKGAMEFYLRDLNG